MNTTMTTTGQFKDLNEFLAKHSAKNEQKAGDQVSFTHTRIPDKDLNVYGGSFIIPKNELSTFYSLYYDSIFVKKRKVLQNLALSVTPLASRQACKNEKIN